MSGRSKNTMLGMDDDLNTNVAELKKHPELHYAVMQHGVFSKTSELLEFPLLYVRTPRGTIVPYYYTVQSRPNGNGRHNHNGQKKKLEIQTLRSKINGDLRAVARDGDSPWGFLRKKLRVVKVNSDAESTMYLYDVQSLKIGS